MSSHPHAHTAIQRPPTGLDEGARRLMIKVVEDLTAARRGSVPALRLLVGCLFHDSYGDLADYVQAVGAVWGESVRYQLEQAIHGAATEAQFGVGYGLDANSDLVGMHVLLMLMPEPDFRFAVEKTLRYIGALEAGAARLTEICRARGVAWRVDAREGFVWIGEEIVEREILAPALSILNDRRFAAGVRVEFEQARVELKAGTPQAYKQGLTEASCAVESAMKVVLMERGIGHDARDAAQKLWEGLRDNGLVAPDTEALLLAVPRARNKRGGHGAGLVAHAVGRAEAEAFVAAAATSIVFLGKLLP